MLHAQKRTNRLHVLEVLYMQVKAISINDSMLSFVCYSVSMGRVGLGLGWGWYKYRIAYGG